MATGESTVLFQLPQKNSRYHPSPHNNSLIVSQLCTNLVYSSGPNQLALTINCVYLLHPIKIKWKLKN
ncbi:MAG: hypothetical protein JWQ06_899 [Mucilaginibacter sp.]|nr:hypothetical protein [Mucilaginibacter sp.]